MAKSPYAGKLTSLTLGLCILGLAQTTTAVADEGAIDYRQHTMQAVGGHMQAAVDILRQKVAHSDHMIIHASALADLAKIAGSLFPEGSEGGDALPAIWEETEDFAQHLGAFREAADGFKAAAASADAAAIGEAFQGLGQSCKSCHDDYRAE
jgi:cytochrome c556